MIELADRKIITRINLILTPIILIPLKEKISTEYPLQTYRLAT